MQNDAQRLRERLPRVCLTPPDEFSEIALVWKGDVTQMRDRVSVLQALRFDSRVDSSELEVVLVNWDFTSAAAVELLRCLPDWSSTLVFRGCLFPPEGSGSVLDAIPRSYCA